MEGIGWNITSAGFTNMVIFSVLAVGLPIGKVISNCFFLALLAIVET